jgi:uncharacterized membrane protein
MKTKTQKIVTASMLATLCCVATMVIKIPLAGPFKGYVNLGDCIVLLAGWLLSPTYGFAAAGIGSALADLLLGYNIYAPATFLIKGIMALIAYYCFKALHNKLGSFSARIIGGILADFLTKKLIAQKRLRNKIATTCYRCNRCKKIFNINEKLED